VRRSAEHTTGIRPRVITCYNDCSRGAPQNILLVSKNWGKKNPAEAGLGQATIMTIVTTAIVTTGASKAASIRSRRCSRSTLSNCFSAKYFNAGCWSRMLFSKIAGALLPPVSYLAASINAAAFISLTNSFTLNDGSSHPCAFLVAVTINSSNFTLTPLPVSPDSLASPVGC
jgi:hypothetical protein